MNVNTISDYSNITIKGGFPSHDFFEKAWASEPLTNVLTETNIPFALPMPDEDISLIAKNEQDLVIGQCSTNLAIKYWNHLENVDHTHQNISTQIFIKIHRKAVQVEKEFIKQINEPLESAFHSAGIAVLPEFRGKNIGLFMRAKQIDLSKQHQATTLFCETTNKFSAATVDKYGFTKIAEYPYSGLAEKLNHPNLSKIDDSFSVWCLKI